MPGLQLNCVWLFVCACHAKDGNFLPKLRDLGIPYKEIPPWMLDLHTGPPLMW